MIRFGDRFDADGQRWMATSTDRAICEAWIQIEEEADEADAKEGGSS